MADNTLEILIKATAGKAIAELKILGKTVKNLGATGGTFDTLKAKFISMDKAMSTPEGMKMMIGIAGSVIGALTGIGLAAKKLADDYMDYAFQVKDFGRIIGATPEEASKLIQVADDVRLSVGSMTAAMRVAIMRGISPTVENLGKLSDAYLAIKDPIERSKFLLDTFGRGGMEMAKLMELGSKAITDMGDSIEGTARLMTEEGIQAATDYYNALDNLGDTSQDLSLSFGQQLIPPLVDAINYLNDARDADTKLGIAMKATDKLVDDHSMTLDEQREVLIKLSDEKLSFAEVMKIVEARTGSLTLKTDTLTGAYDELSHAMDSGIITQDKYNEIISKLESGEIDLEDVTVELTAAYTEYRRVLAERLNPTLHENIRLLMMSSNAVTDAGDSAGEAAADYEDLSMSVSKLGQSVNDASGQIKGMATDLANIPTDINFNFKLPNIEDELANFVKEDAWKAAGGAALQSFYAGISGGMKTLSEAQRLALSKSLGALSLSMQVEIGEIDKAAAEKKFNELFGGTAGEAKAMINAAIALDPNTEADIRTAVETLMTTPFSFIVQPAISETTLDGLKSLMANTPFVANINPAISALSKAQLITQIIGSVKDKEVPVNIVAKLKEMSKGDLEKIAASIIVPPVAVSMEPVLDQAALDDILELINQEQTTFIASPIIDVDAMSEVNKARAAIGRAIYVPVIFKMQGQPGQKYRTLTTAEKMFEIKNDVDLNDNGIIGGQYGLDMIIPPGYKGDKFPIMASSGERVTIQTPAQQQSNSSGTINNYFNITVQNDVDERQLARLITREQVRTGTR